MQPFAELLILALQQSGCSVRTIHYVPDDETGILRVTTDDGREFSIHFDPA